MNLSGLGRFVRLLAVLASAAALTAGCLGGVAPATGAISGYVVKFAGARGVSEGGAEALYILPEPGANGVSRATVFWSGPSGTGYVITGGDGYFLVGSLRPGNYEITIYHPDFVNSFYGIYPVYAGSTTHIGQHRLGSVRILTIGIAAYLTGGALDGPVNDAELLCDGLGTNNQLVNEAWILKDDQATKDAIISSIQSLSYGLGSDDTFIVTFSGHGYRNLEESHEYLVPWDHDGTVGSYISDTELGNLVDLYLPSCRTVFILDACYSGGMASAAGAVPAGMKRSTSFDLMARNISGPNRIVMTACEKDEVSYEFPGLPIPDRGENTYGLFAWAFAHGIWGPDYPADTGPYGPDGHITCAEAFSYASEMVTFFMDRLEPHLPEGRQTPWLYDPYNLAPTTYIFSHRTG
ncbi:MAG: caspase family protein [Bacillota bacterium]